MPRENISDHERERRLREMLSRFSPDGELGHLKETLESSSASSDSATESLENLTSGGPSSSDDESFVIETLDVLISKPGDGVLDAEQLLGLEAIVHKRFRPAVFVQGNSFRSMPNPWTHLGQGDNRRTIESVIPAIGRVEIPDHPSLPYGGTGFVVGENLVMTNRHVAEIFCRGVGQKDLCFVPGQRAQIDFLEEQGNLQEIVVDVERVLMIHPYWDMALLKVKSLPKGVKPLVVRQNLMLG